MVLEMEEMVMEEVIEEAHDRGINHRMVEQTLIVGHVGTGKHHQWEELEEEVIEEAHKGIDHRLVEQTLTGYVEE